MKIYGDDAFRPLSVSADTLIGAIKFVADEAPETVYEAPEHMCYDADGAKKDVTCFYVHRDEEGEPTGCGCIIGKALERIGVPLSELAKHEGQTAYQMFPHVISLDYDELDVRERATYFATDVQIRQDSGVTWGKAVQSAADYRGIAL